MDDFKLLKLASNGVFFGFESHPFDSIRFRFDSVRFRFDRSRGWVLQLGG